MEKYNDAWKQDIKRIIGDMFINYSGHKYFILKEDEKDVAIRRILYYLSKVFGKGYISEDEYCIYNDENENSWVEMDFAEDLILEVLKEYEKRTEPF